MLKVKMETKVIIKAMEVLQNLSERWQFLPMTGMLDCKSLEKRQKKSRFKG